jgi:DNA polymerase III alpha subunit
VKQNKFSEMIFSDSDVCDLIMQGRDPISLGGMIVDDSINLAQISSIVEPAPNFLQQQVHNCSVPVFHAQQQSTWHMPDQYKVMDIAAHVLSLCNNDTELQRCGQELLLYQQHNLFDLLRYLKYLVDVMQTNQIVWGVGRGSSCASYILYKLKVHRIDSLFYELDITEFLR